MQPAWSWTSADIFFDLKMRQIAFAAGAPYAAGEAHHAPPDLLLDLRCMKGEKEGKAWREGKGTVMG